MKVCTKCNINKDESEFYFRPKTDKLQSWCKECTHSVKPTRIIVCKRCNKEKLIRAKGMCDACWQANQLEGLRGSDNFYVETPLTKICQRCNIEKEASSFAGNQNSRDKLQAWCKGCDNNFRKEKLSDPKIRMEYNEKARRDWNEKYKFNEKTIERRRAYDKDRWHNDEEYRLKKQAYDKERERKYNRAVGRRATQKRRAIEKGLPHDLTDEQWLEIVAWHDSCCRYCGNQYDELDLEQEHQIPLTRGGGYTASNIAPSCTTCNRKKHTKTEEEFIAFMRAHPKEFSYAKSIR